MIFVNSTFFLVLLGWSIFMPFLCIYLGYWAAQEKAE